MSDGTRRVSCFDISLQGFIKQFITVGIRTHLVEHALIAEID